MSCTYTITRDKFIHQNWVNCYTCFTDNSSGCCMNCARTCHSNHKLSEIRTGNFYCDCKCSKGCREGVNPNQIGLHIINLQGVRGGGALSNTPDSSIRDRKVNNTIQFLLPNLEGKVYSPLSAYILYSMLAHGTSNPIQILQLLDLQLNNIRLPVSMLLSSYNVLMSNIQIKQEFLDKLGTNCEYINNLDLTVLNNWVKEKSRGLIPRLYNVDNIQAILANVVYFKGKWKIPFNVKSTKESLFNDSRNESFMYSNDSYAYYEEDGFQKLEMDYQDGGQIGFILPNENVDYKNDLLPLSLTRFNNQVYGKGSNTYKFLNYAINSRMSKETVNVYIPRFTVECEHELTNLIQLPQFDKVYETGNMDFSKIIQKVKIIVDEEGTEASAVTACMMLGRASIPKEFTFRADRPFIYYIRDGESILFIGHYK